VTVVAAQKTDTGMGAWVDRQMDGRTDEEIYREELAHRQKEGGRPMDIYTIGLTERSIKGKKDE
jgi:hypothetical protein